MLRDGKPEIMGVAQWAVLKDSTLRYLDAMELAPDETWESSSEKERASHVWELYMQPRRKLIREEKLPIICQYARCLHYLFTHNHANGPTGLQILCIWPQYQRRGAGTLLVKWGCDLADRINAICTVEASGPGRALYEGCGFELQEAESVRFMTRKRAQEA